MSYKKGVTDPDYCVLKFTAKSGRYAECISVEEAIERMKGEIQNRKDY